MRALRQERDSWGTHQTMSHQRRIKRERHDAVRDESIDPCANRRSSGDLVRPDVFKSRINKRPGLRAQRARLSPGVSERNPNDVYAEMSVRRQGSLILPLINGML